MPFKIVHPLYVHCQVSLQLAPSDTNRIVESQRGVYTIEMYYKTLMKGVVKRVFFCVCLNVLLLDLGCSVNMFRKLKFGRTINNIAALTDNNYTEVYLHTIAL